MAASLLTDRYALYHGDCIAVMRALPAQSVHLSVYSPPFAGLYQYSSQDEDLSNCLDRGEFLEHYNYVIDEVSRLTLPGRFSAVHCTDIAQTLGNQAHLYDLPGDIVRAHESRGWQYVARYHVWKEPLTVRNRTMAKSLHHKTLCEDSTLCSIANADYLIIFRNRGANPIPVDHPTGLMDYAGERRPPADVLPFRGFQGNQIENRFSQWIWRQYASAFWDDVRLDRVLPFKQARDEQDERHVHPLQLDVIERALVLWSNPGETVLTPFMGVGSEAYAAVRNGRRALGIELKESYYRQAEQNVKAAELERDKEQAPLFADMEPTI